jgi:hypothetical protein
MLTKPMPVRFEQEARKRSRGRLTRPEPWSGSTLKKAYQQMGREWDALEEDATKAQGKPDFND